MKKIISTGLAYIGCLLGIIALILMLAEISRGAYLVSASGGGSCTANSITWGTQPSTPIVVSGSTQNLSGDAIATSGGTIIYSSSNTSAFTISGTTLSPTATAGNVCQTGYVEANSAATGNYCAANQLPSNLVTVYPAPPTGVSAGSPTTTSFQVTFTCGSGAASCNIDYGTSTSYGSNTGTVTSPATLSGLSAGTTYHFRVNSVASCGTTNGSDNTEATSLGSLITVGQTGTSGSNSGGGVGITSANAYAAQANGTGSLTTAYAYAATNTSTISQCMMCLYNNTEGASGAPSSSDTLVACSSTFTLSTVPGSNSTSFSGSITNNNWYWVVGIQCNNQPWYPNNGSTTQRYYNGVTSCGSPPANMGAFSSPSWGDAGTSGPIDAYFANE